MTGKPAIIYNITVRIINLIRKFSRAYSFTFSYVFYFTNGKPNLFYKEPTNHKWKKLETEKELYGFKFKTDGKSMAYLAKDGDWIKLKGNELTYNSEEISRNGRGALSIKEAKTYTRGCFENDYDHFYYLTYSDTSNFACDIMMQVIV